MVQISKKASSFTESVIRGMTRLAREHGAINLAQGFPDFACPMELKESAVSAIMADINQYAITWGSKSLRDAISAHAMRFYGRAVDPEREITVTCGSTEAMISTVMAIVDPGDEVIIFEPYYENYGPDAILSDAVPRYVSLRFDQAAGDWLFDPDELKRAFNAKTRAIIINTPQNPTGKVFSREELSLIAGLCIEHDVVAITDEIYEHITFDGTRHIPIATLPGMAERTVTVSGLSKTFSVTGWRIGYAIACPMLTDAIRKVHDFLTVGASAPLQEAGATALTLPDAYFEGLSELYRQKRDLFVPGLKKIGFDVYMPRGAYYVMAGYKNFSSIPDADFARYLTVNAKVAVVPGSSFLSGPGENYARFCFCKKEETLLGALSNLEDWARKGL